jgi:membrane peptidoglycan carboxypeptidase
MSNMWNSQQPDRHQAIEQNAPPRSGSLLREYRQQQARQSPQSPPEYSPIGSPQPPAQSYNPYSPMPGTMPSQQNGSPYGRGGMWANSVQKVKELSGKVVAMHRAGYEPPPPPMERYHPPRTSQPLPQAKKPWRRSHTLRIKRQRRLYHPTVSTGRRFGTILLITLTCLVLVLISSGGAYAYAYYQSQLPRLQSLASQQIAQTTHIYDRNGVLLYDAYDQSIGGGRRTYVDYKYIPQVMLDAMTSAEDPTFWDNSGVDPTGITRAAIEFASSGHVQSGGSTITQQLIKDLTGDTQDTLQRKIPEATLAIALTQQYSKAKILEMYLNIAPFGSQDLGVEAAAQEYFGLQPQCTTNFSQGVFNCSLPAIAQLDYNTTTHKHDPMLALARASLLAGMPQNPVSYDPVLGPNNKALALVRQDYVLNQMARYGVQVQGVGTITPAVIKKAEAMTAAMTFTPYQHKELAPHFVNWVIPQLEIALGNGNQANGTEAFLNGGFTVRTTLDYQVEKYVEAAVTRHLTQPEYQPFLGDYGPINVLHDVNDAAVNVINAKTGEILVMDGSSNYNSTDPRIQGQFNVVTGDPTTKLGRQPGSSFKIIDYVTAFEMGWYPGIVLPDVQTYFPKGDGGTDINNAYVPNDYNDIYSNTMNTIRGATANSRNVPAVKALEFAGIDNVVNTARRFGITALDDETALYNARHGTHDTPAQYYGPAVALGTALIPLIQMVGAYQVLADQGMRVPPQSILDIWDSYGHHLYHYDTTHPPATQVVTPQIAYLMTSILADEPARAPEFGNDHILSLWDMDPTHTDEVAAKTGTTDNFVDNLTLGYTPDFVVGVWAGNANNEPMYHTIGLTGAAPIWHSVVENLLGQCNYDSTTSNNPDGIPCTDMQDVKALHFTDLHFPLPPDLVQAPTSGYNGLMGSGNYDWMLDGEQPMQSGYVPPCQPNNNGGNNNNGMQGCGNNGGGNNGGGNNGGGNNGGGNNGGH